MFSITIRRRDNSRLNAFTSQQFQTGKHRKQFAEMLFQAAGLVCFVSFDRPTGEMQFEGVGKDIEHVEQLAVFVFHLFGGFAIDGGDDVSIVKKKV